MANQAWNARSKSGANHCRLTPPIRGSSWVNKKLWPGQRGGRLWCYFRLRRWLAGFENVVPSLCFFTGQGKVSMTFLALLSCSRRRRFEVKRHKYLVQFHATFPVPIFATQKGDPAATSVSPWLGGVPETRKGKSAKDERISTFRSHLERLLFLERRAWTGFVGRKDECWRTRDVCCGVLKMLFLWNNPAENF